MNKYLIGGCFTSKLLKPTTGKVYVISTPYRTEVVLKKCPVIEYWENKQRINEYEAFANMHTYDGTLTKCPRKL